ncbi:MAG: alpha-glucosidase C-terminal domain-containing protein [Candidatus Methanoperedens sp.]|nr:alpha-glucosidase C-terminal domain-containing protein [Candidatus Methanoperedens sp.]
MTIVQTLSSEMGKVIEKRHEMILAHEKGQEIGATNPYLSDAPVEWDKGDYELKDFYKKVIGIRNRNDALKYGSTENVWKAGDNTFAYLRSYTESKAAIVINFQNKEVSSTLSLPFESGIILRDELNNESFVVNDPNNFKIKLQPYGSRILV